LTQGLRDDSDQVTPGKGKTSDTVVYALHSVPSIYTWVNVRVVEAPVSSRRGGVVVPVRAIGGLIQVLQSLSLSGWDVGEVKMSTAVNIIPVRSISGVIWILKSLSFQWRFVVTGCEFSFL
jgi:hypothetical protein